MRLLRRSLKNNLSFVEGVKIGSINFNYMVIQSDKQCPFHVNHPSQRVLTVQLALKHTESVAAHNPQSSPTPLRRVPRVPVFENMGPGLTGRMNAPQDGDYVNRCRATEGGPGQWVICCLLWVTGEPLFDKKKPSCIWCRSYFINVFMGVESGGGGDASPAVEKSAGRPPRNYDISVSFFVPRIRILHFPTFSK